MRYFAIQKTKEKMKWIVLLMTRRIINQYGDNDTRAENTKMEKDTMMCYDGKENQLGRFQCLLK